MHEVLRTAVRVLTFRASREELLSLDRRHLTFGLVCTWLVGIGRWWDDPGAPLFLHLGLGSVLYVFILSLLLWLIVWPLRPQDWSYERLLTYVTLTSPPATLYAIPVERLWTLDAANRANVYLLGVVAVWRVALWIAYLARLGRLGAFRVLVAALLPLTGIVVTLTLMNLHRVVFDFMAGIRNATTHGAEYIWLLTVSYFSLYAFLPLLLAYLGCIVTLPAELHAEQSTASASDPNEEAGTG